MPERIIVEPKRKIGDLTRVSFVLNFARLALPDASVIPLYRVETFPDEPVFEYIDSDEVRRKKPSGFSFTRRLGDYNDTIKTNTIVERGHREGEPTWIIQNKRYQMNTGRLSSFIYIYPQFPGEIEIARCVFDVDYTPSGQEVDYTHIIITPHQHQAQSPYPNPRFKPYKPSGNRR